MNNHDIHYNKTEVNLIDEIRVGNEKAFEELFFKFYYQLCRFAFKMTKSNDLARDCVQEVFFKIWKNRRNLDIHYSLNAYLYRAVRNQALNLIEQEETQNRLSVLLYKDDFPGEEMNQAYGSVDPLSQLSERINKIWELLDEMPEQQRIVFELHRKDGLSYREIAEVLDIARKTVENHMGRALKYLRESLDKD